MKCAEGSKIALWKPTNKTLLYFKLWWETLKSSRHGNQVYQRGRIFQFNPWGGSLRWLIKVSFAFACVIRESFLGQVSHSFLLLSLLLLLCFPIGNKKTVDSLIMSSVFDWWTTFLCWRYKSWIKQVNKPFCGDQVCGTHFQS